MAGLKVLIGYGCVFWLDEYDVFGLFVEVLEDVVFQAFVYVQYEDQYEDVLEYVQCGEFGVEFVFFQGGKDFLLVVVVQQYNC